MGQPFYQIRPLVDRGQVTVFSANFALYGDLSRRVMATLRSLVPGIEVYSIDEAFFDLRGMAEPLDELGRTIGRTIRRNVGIPVSIGIAKSIDFFNLVHRPSFKICSIPDIRQERLSINGSHHNLLDAAGGGVLLGKGQYITLPAALGYGIGAADCRIAAPCFSSVLPYMFIPLSLGVVCHKGEAVEEQFFFRQPFKDGQLGTGDLGIHFVLVDVPAGVDDVIFRMVYIAVIAQAV